MAKTEQQDKHEPGPGFEFREVPGARLPHTAIIDYDRGDRLCPYCHGPVFGGRQCSMCGYRFWR